MTHTNEQDRAEFERIMRNSPAYKTALMNRIGDRYEFDTMESAWQGFLIGMQAARRAQVVPQGWKLVPEDPSLEMQQAALKYVSRQHQTRDAYAEMLAAAPQPPEAAPVVPQFSKVAKKKLDFLLEAGEEITGYAIQNKDGRRGAIDCHGFVYWWQDAAPVQMPEPAAWRYTTANRRTYAYRGARKDFDKEYPILKPEPLYTEHQVRQLLAAHGVK